MDVSPATVDQVRLGRDGRVHTITAADSQVAADLDRLGEIAQTTFVLRFHDETEHWSIIQRYGPAEDDEQLTATTTRSELLPLLVAELERKINRDWDLAAELDAADDQAERERAQARDERLSEVAEYGAFKHRVHADDRAFIPRSIGGA